MPSITLDAMQAAPWMPLCDEIHYRVTLTNNCLESFTDLQVFIMFPTNTILVDEGESNFPNFFPNGGFNSFLQRWDSEIFDWEFVEFEENVIILDFYLQGGNCDITGFFNVFAGFVDSTNGIITSSVFDQQNDPFTPCIIANGSLNQLITNGDVPNYNTCNFVPNLPVPRTLLVTTQLNVDVPFFCLSSGNHPSGSTRNILLAPGANIVVQNGATLNVSDYTIRGCDEMWESITVQQGGELSLRRSDIEDARTAITAQNGSTVSIRRNVFTNNLVGLLVPENPAGLQTVNFNEFIGNTFQGIGNLKPPLQSQIPRSGIEITDLTFLNVPFQASGSASFSNVFRNMHNGIVSKRSNLAVDRAVFEDIQPSGSKWGVAVKVTNGGFCQVNGFGNNPADLPTFDNCEIGILVSGIGFFSCDGNRMLDMGKGVSIKTSSFFQSHEIINSGVEARDIGIQLFGNSLSSSTIENNWIDMDHPDASLNSFAIKIDLPPFSGFNPANVVNNFINLQNARHGIHLTSGSMVNVMNNTVFMEDPNVLIYRGISLNGTDNSVLECNYINGNASSSDYKEGIGIYVSDTPAGIRCNTVANSKIGINFNGQCLGTELQGNTYNIHEAGLSLGLGEGVGQTFIGQQYFPNQNNPSLAAGYFGNRWEDLNSTDDNNNDDVVGARHWGLPIDIISSLFKVTANSFNQSKVFMPSIETPNAPTAQWFVNVSNSSLYTYNCQTENTCINGVGTFGFVSDDEDKLQKSVAENQFSASAFAVPLRWTGARKLYTNLMRNPTQVETGSIFESFVSQEANTSVGSMHEVQMATEGLYQLNATDEATLVQHQANINTFITTILQKDVLLSADPDSVTEAALLSDKTMLLDDLEEEVANWTTFKGQLELAKHQDAALIAQDNETIAVSELHEDNEQKVNDIYLKSYAIAIEPDKTQLSTLEGIANQCPLSGGAAVYRARALIGGANYDDYLLCTSALEKADEKSNEDVNSTNFIIRPNPVLDRLQLLLPENVQSIVVTNQLGSVVGKYENTSFGERWNVPLDLPNGVYFCTIETKAERLTKSFVVINN